MVSRGNPCFEEEHDADIGPGRGGLSVVLLLPATAAAQATITGVVNDASGAVLPGVTVEAAAPR